MIDTVKTALWRQMGASIDMLENAIKLCPDTLWDNERLFWYWSYHCIFWTDYYLTLDPENFQPPAPFTLSEFDSGGVLPDVVYTKLELLDYLEFCREKAYDLIKSFTPELVEQAWVNKTKNFTVMEILIYNIRHIQHHAAQFNKILREEINQAPRWVSIPKQQMI